MSVFNGNNDGLKHPAFHDEKIEKKQTWVKILDFLFGVIVALGLIACVLFCIWLIYFRERM